MDVRDMTDEQIYAEFEKAYKEAAKKVHPDTKQTPEEREKATRLMLWLNLKRDEVLKLKKL